MEITWWLESEQNVVGRHVMFNNIRLLNVWYDIVVEHMRPKSYITNEERGGSSIRR